MYYGLERQKKSKLVTSKWGNIRDTRNGVLEQQVYHQLLCVASRSHPVPDEYYSLAAIQSLCTSFELQLSQRKAE